jgi:HSP20 family protein
VIKKWPAQPLNNTHSRRKNPSPALDSPSTLPNFRGKKSSDHKQTIQEDSMSIIQYDPWRQLQQLQREMGSMFDRRLYDDNESAALATNDWVPAVDIKEDDNRFLIIADVPGVEPDDIKVHMENGMLSIEGERKEEHKEEQENYRRVERVYGCFHRRFNLPDTADAENITARSRNGSLEISIPKREPSAQSRRITVEH